MNTAIKKNPAHVWLIVVHRPEPIAMAQRVVVLHQGKVVQDVMQEVKAAA